MSVFARGAKTDTDGVIRDRLGAIRAVRVGSARGFSAGRGLP